LWVSQDDLNKRILKSTDPEIAVFSAQWCPFCRRFNETIGKENIDYKTPIEVIDADSGDGSLWDTYHIDIVPTIIVFRNGKESFRIDGKSMRGLSQADLETAIKNVRA